MFNSNKISTYSNIPYRPSSQHSTVSAFKTDHICYAQYTNYLTATHILAHSPCTSTCTPHQALPTPLPSTILLCTQLTNTKHNWQNGTECRDDMKLLWCHSNLVWLGFEGSILHALVSFMTLIYRNKGEVKNI